MFKNRISCPTRVLALLLFLLGPSLSFAESPSLLELARGLRQEGMPDLAMEYLDEISNKVTGQDKLVLALEYARTRLDLAANEPEEGKRKEYLTKARTGFAQFLKDNPNHEMRPEASLELARLTGLQASDRLAEAAEMPADSEERTEAVEDVRKLFKSTADRFETASKELVEKIQNLPEPKTPLDRSRQFELVRLQRRSMLEQGVNLLKYGQSFDVAGGGAKGVQQRGKLIDDAQEVFRQLATLDRNDPDCAEALAWIAQCDYMKDAGKRAEEQFQYIMRLTGRDRATMAAKRQARYFMIKNFVAAKEGNPWPTVAAEARTWLNVFPQYANTREGLDMRYYLATAMRAQAEGVLKPLRDETTGFLKQAPPGNAVGYLRDAEKIYRSLTETENIHTSKANKFLMRTIIDLAAGKQDGDPETYTKFDDAYLAAQVEQAKFVTSAERGAESGQLELKEVQEKELRAYSRIVELLEYWLPRTNKDDDPKEVFEARLLHLYALLTTDRAMQAAVYGEYVAKNNPDEPKAVRAAATALQGYLSSGPGDGVPEEDLNRAYQLAKFMDANPVWAEEMAVNAARHQLGLIAYNRQDYEGAVEALSRVRIDYPNIFQSRLMEGASAFLLNRQESIPDSKKITWLKKAITDLSEMPPLPTGARGDTINAYFMARIQHGQLHLTSTIGEYAKAREIGKQVAEDVAKLDGEALSGSRKAELGFSARALELGAIYSLANDATKKDDFEKVDEILNPVLAEIEKSVTEKLTDEQTEAPSLSRVQAYQRNLLVLALRANVQSGGIDRARDLLGVLREAGGSIEATVNVMKQVVNEVRIQINRFNLDGKTEEAKELSESFAKLLDEIAADSPKDNTQLTIFLANGYNSIDRHSKAAELLDTIPPPKPSDPNYDTLKTVYQTVEFLKARANRQAKNFDKAEALLKNIMGTNEKKGWGFNSVEIRKERFLLTEDQAEAAKKLQAAFPMWKEVMGSWGSYQRIYQTQWQKEKQLGITPEIPEGATEQEIDDIKGTHRRQAARFKDIAHDLFLDNYRCMARYTALLDQYEDSKGKYADVKDKNFVKVAEALVKLEELNAPSDEDPDAGISDEIKQKMENLLKDYPKVKAKYKELGGKLVK